MILRRVLIPATLILSLTSAVATAAVLQRPAPAHPVAVAHKHSRARAHRRTIRHRTTRRRGRSAGTLVLSTAKTTLAGTADSALFGDEAVEATTDNNVGGVAEAFPFSSQTAGTATALHVYVDSRSSATTLIAGIYADGGGHPGPLLAAGSLQSLKPAAWNVVSLPTSRVSTGRTYWLALLGRGGTLYFRDRRGGSQSFTSRQTTLTALPGTWATARQWASAPASVYVSGSVATASGGGAAPSASPTPTPASAPTPTPISAPTATPTPTPNPTPAPVAAPANNTLPSITGAAVLGQTLSASPGAWSGSPIGYTYAWQHCDSSGSACATIGGATGGTYTLAAADVGYTVRVLVAASNAGGSTTAGSAVTPVVSGPANGTGCTSVVTSASAASFAVASAAGGSVICLAPGSYSGLSLSGTHSSDVTIEPEPTLDPNAGGQVTIGLSSVLQNGMGGYVAVNVSPNSSHIVIHDLYITSTISIGPGSSYITIDHNDIDEQSGVGDAEAIDFATSDCTVPNAPTWTNCAPLAPISNVTISGNHIHDINSTTSGGDDALHTNNFRNLHITGNEINGYVENNAGGHVDCLQNVFGGQGLTYDHNYLHDNECQPFFLKDGDISGVTFNDNLFLRDTVPATNGGSSAGFSQVYNSANLVMQHNTVWDGKGLTLKCITSTVVCAASVDHNVWTSLTDGGSADPTRYSLTESYNVLGSNPWSFSRAATDSVSSSPAFACGASCGNGTIAGDDYRLASNPNGVGIDWAPSQYTYGPTGS